MRLESLREQRTYLKTKELNDALEELSGQAALSKQQKFKSFEEVREVF